MTFLVSNPDNETDGGTLELDGASSVVSADVGGFTYVFVAGGVDDGISVFRLLANGTLTPVHDVTDDATFELDGARGLSTAMVDGNTYLFVAGQADNGVSVFRVGTNGSLTNVANVTDDATMLLTGVSDTATARVGTSTYLFTAGTTENGISIFRVNGDGRLTYLSNHVDAGALELAGVRAMTTVTIGATAFLIAGGTDDGISVFSINATTGALTGTDDENDTVSINLQDVSDITTAVIGGVTYVFVAGAADNGVSVYSLSGAGVLTHLESEFDSATSLIAGANSVTVTVLGGITYLHVGGTESGTSLYQFIPTETAGRILQHVDPIADSGSRELSGTTTTGTASVGGTTYLLGAGATDDGVSVFGTQTTGQLWYSTEGNLADARIAFVNTDGGNHVTFLDNNPGTTLTTGFVEAVAIDSAAGIYYAIVTGNEGINARLIMGRIGSLTPPTVVFTFDPTFAGVENNLAFHIDINTFTETLYIGYIEFIPTFGDSTQGIRQFSYNPLTGAVSGGSFLVTETTAQTPAGTAGADGLFASQDMAFDTTRGVFYSQNLALGDGFETNTILRFSLANPGGAAGVSVINQAQFPLNGNGSDFTTLNGIIADIEIDEDSNRLYFLTRAEDVEENTGEDAIWMIANASTAVNATAVKLTLVGVVQADFYPEDMTLDEVNNILYIETENSNLVGGGITDAIMVFQLDAAGTTATLINTINLSFGATANLEGMHYSYIAALSGISGTATPATEQGASLVLLTGAPTVSDFDGDHLASATVQITGGTFNSNENSFDDDDLGIGAGMAQSGTIAGTNIVISWNQATGTLTLTGYDTFANYQAALATVRYQSTGNNPTNYGLNPTRTITWTVSDGLPGIPGGQANSATTQLTITAINDGPTNTVPGAQVMNEDSPLNLAISIADPDLNPAITDIVVTLTATNGTLTLLTNVALGLTAADIAGNGTGLVTITATRNEINTTFAAVGGLVFLNTPDYNGPASVQIVTNDGGNTGNDPGISGTGTTEQDSDTISITVNAVVDIANDAPSFAEDSGGGAQTIDVLANDTFENAARFISSVTQGLHGVVTIVDGPDADGIMDYVVYTQVADYEGTDSFTYTVTSGGVTETATVNVTITAVADVVNDSPTVAEDSGTTTVDVLGNDSFENAARFISGVTQGLHGTVTIVDGPDADGIMDYVTYTPIADYNGADSFTYTVTSGGVTETATVNVNITAVADIADDNVIVLEDSGVTNLTLLANDSFENAGRAITSVTQGVNGGTVTINNNGTAGDPTDDFVTYAPAANYAGPDSFTYTVTSGGVTETATVNVTVTPVNDAPTSTNLSGDTVTWTEGNAIVLLDLGSNATIADIDSANFDGGTLTVAITGGLVAGQDQLVIDTSGTVTTGAGTVSVGGTQIGTFTGGGAGGAPLVFTFDADATPAAVQTLVRAIGYTNSAGDDPTDGNRTLTWTLVDGDGVANGGADTLQVTTTLDVDPVNDAPAGADATITINEDNTHVFTAANFGFTDALDADNFAGVVITTLPATGTLSLNGVPIVVAGTFVSATDISNNLLTYLPGLNGSGDTYASFTFQVRDDGGTADGGQNTDQSANTITFDVDPVNDAPTLLNLNGNAATFTEDGAAVLLDVGSNATVGDIDSANFDGGTLIVSITGNAVPAEDVLGIVNQGTGAGQIGVSGADISYGGTVFATFTGGSAGANLFVTFDADATPAAVQALVRLITYANSNLINPSTAQRGITWNLTDGDGTANGGADAVSVVSTVDIAAINDAPSGADVTRTTSEDDAYTFLATDFGFTDGDGNTLLAVRITTLPADGVIRLNGVAVSAGQFITVADINAGLLVFTPDLDEFNTPYTTFTFQVQDNGATGGANVNLDPSANTFTFNVTADNFPPVVDLNGTDGGNDFASAYTEDGAAAVIADTDVTITDADVGDQVESATITITDAVFGDQLTVVGVLPGSIVATGGGTATLTLTGTGTHAEYQQALTQIRYSTTGNNPTVGGTDLTRSITVTVDDGSSSSAAATTTVTVTGSNDPPAGTDATITLTEDTPRLLAQADFGFTDPDSGDAFSSVTITGVTGGTLYYDADGTGGAGLPVAVASFPQTYTAAELAAGNVSYQANANSNGAGVGTITFQVTDNSGAGNNTDPSANTLTVDVTAVNDQPNIPNSPTVTTDEQVAVTLNAAITVSDVDLDARNGGAGDYSGAAFAINRSVSNAEDVFSFNTAGAQFTVNGSNLESGGNVIATLAQSGGILNINFVNNGTVPTTALVNDVLQHLQYTNTSNEPPASVTLIYIIDDGAPGGGQGALGSPFNNIDGGQVTVNINSINDAPSGTDNTITINEDTGRVLAAADFGFSDTAEGDAFAGVLLTTLPTAGILVYDSDGPGGLPGVLASAGQFVTAAELALGALTYFPASNGNGTGHASFTFQVRDDAGTANGGQNTDQSPNTITFDVTAVDDRPTGTDKTITLSEDDPYTFTAADFGFGDVDSDTFVSVTIDTLATDGTLLLNGVAVTAGQTVSVTDINGNLLTFQPTLDEFASPYATFTFTVNDDGGAGLNSDATPNTITLNVTPDNLPPAVDLDGGTGGVNYTASYTEDGAAAAIGSGVTVTDPNSGTGDMIESATIVLTDRVAGDALTVTGALPGGFFAVTTPTAGAITIQITGTGTGAQYQALIQSIQYSTTSQDPTVGGTDTARTITVTVNDGTVDSAVATTTVNIIAIDDAAVAQDDAVATDEATPLNGNVLLNNGSGADADVDGPPPTVSAVNGSGASVGTQILLPSGALLTLNANGTFTYDPNGAFDETPGPSSGAANQPATDQFSYTLTGGGTATVTVTIAGIDDAGGDYLVGSDLPDVLDGGDGNDTIYGGQGGDTMVGGDGDDIYFVDNAGDVVVEAAGGGNDRIFARGDYTLYAGQYVEILSTDWHDGTAPIALGGNELNNIIYGNEGDNILYGKGGADYLEGRGGNDSYYVDNAGDLVVEVAGGGADRIFASADYTLYAGQHVEILSTDNNAGTAAINLGGNELDNIIYGNDGNNLLDGKGGHDTLIGLGGHDILSGNAGNDYLFGEAGNDSLHGGAGNDVLTGGSGEDSFWFTTALGVGNVDIITDYSGVGSGFDDIILLDDAVFAGLALGSLNPNAFAVGNAAQDADDRIIYDTNTGALYFDADGNGAGAAVHFATLLGSPALTAGDFSVI